MTSTAFAQKPETEPNNSPATANSASLGDTVSGTLRYIDGTGTSGEDAIDWWVLNVTAGQTIAAHVDASESGSGLDSRLALYASDGKTVLASSDNWDGLDPYLEYVAPSTDKYYVAISTGPGPVNPQPYIIEFTRTQCPTTTDAPEPNDKPAQAVPITIGQTIHGHSCPFADVDYFTFQAAAGAKLQLQVDTVGRNRPAFGCACGIEPFMQLLAPNGTTTLANTTSGEYPKRIDYTVTSAGTYYVSIAIFAGGTRYPYTLRTSQTGGTGSATTGPGDPTTVRADGLGHPWSVSADPIGDLIVTDPDDNQIWWVAPDGRKQVITRDVPSPQRLAWDMFGNLLITSAHAVYKLTPTGQVSPWIIRDLINDAALAPDGSLWFSVAGGTLLHYSAAGAPIEQIAVPNMQSGPNLLAIGAGGDVFFTDHGATGATTVFRLVNKQPLKLFSISWRAGDMVLDDHGQLYLTGGDLTGANNGVYRYSQGGAALDNPLAAQVSVPTGLAFGRDNDGKMNQRLFVLEFTNGRLLELNAAGIGQTGTPVGFATVAQAAADLLKPGSALTDQQRQALDAVGNNNGHFDVGDLRAFLIQTTTLSASRRFGAARVKP